MRNYILLFLAVFIGVLFLTRPSASDVEKCMETTNYGQDRCIFELSR